MIHIGIPGLPITTNHAYTHIVTGKGGKRIVKRVLTKEGRKYKTETTSYIVSNYPSEMLIFKPNTPYGYIIQLVFPNLLNTTWPEESQTRYKKIDASNRIKLLEDAAAEAFGIDDCNFLSTRADKAQGGREYTHIWVWDMEKETPYR